MGTGTPYVIAAILDNPITLLLVRICLTVPFLIGGLMKLINFQAGEAEMADVGLRPAWAFNVAVILVEIGGSVLVILDWMTWLGAGMLGVFTVLSTFLGHRFWQLTGEARAKALNSFLEHVTIGAAFVLVVVVGLHGQGK